MLNTKIAARTAAMTDAHPLTAHAQGTSFDPVLSNQVKPIGNGTPIKNPIGARLNPNTMLLGIRDFEHSRWPFDERILVVDDEAVIRTSSVSPAPDPQRAVSNFQLDI